MELHEKAEAENPLFSPATGCLNHFYLGQSLLRYAVTALPLNDCFDVCVAHLTYVENRFTVSLSLAARDMASNDRA